MSAESNQAMLQMLWTSIIGDKKVVCAFGSENYEDLEFIRRLVEEGKFKTVIDRRFILDQVAEVHSYAESGQKKGNIIIEVIPQVSGGL